jgi:hypothetical protein
VHERWETKVEFTKVIDSALQRFGELAVSDDDRALVAAASVEAARCRGLLEAADRISGAAGGALLTAVRIGGPTLVMGGPALASAIEAFDDLRDPRNWTGVSEGA